MFENKNREVVKLAIDIAKIYGLAVVAEGVENEEALQYLREQGCDYYQGFLFSQAVPFETICRYFQEEKR